MQYIFSSSYNTVVYTIDIQYLIVEIAFVLSNGLAILLAVVYLMKLLKEKFVLTQGQQYDIV